MILISHENVYGVTMVTKSKSGLHWCLFTVHVWQAELTLFHN